MALITRGSTPSGGGVAFAPVTLTAVSGTITPNAALGYGPHRHTATANVTLAEPTGGGDGQPIEVQVTASGGDRTLTVAGSTVKILSGETWWGRLSRDAGRSRWLLDDSGGGSGGGSVVKVDGVTVAELDIDSAAVGWADLPRRTSWVSGRYYGPRCAQLGSTSEPANEELRLVPEFVPNAVTVSEVSVEVTLAGSAGAVVRLVIADDSSGRPGSVVYCSGALAATTTGKKSVTGLTVALDAGRYHFGAVTQGDPTTKPQYRSVLAPVEMTEQPDTPSYQRAAYSRYGVAAALSGAVGTVGLDAGEAPRVQVRVA